MNNRSVNDHTVEEHYILFVSITPEEQSIGQRTQVEEHYILFVLVTFKNKTNHPYLVLTNVARKGWSDPPSHRLPVHNELQTDLDSLRRPPAARSSGEETWGKNSLFAPASPSRRRETQITCPPPPPSSEFIES